MQPCYRTRWHRGQRLPAGYGPGAGPRLRSVGDTRKQPAQLDRGRQLAALLEGGADRSGFYIGDHEHPESMGSRSTTGKRPAKG